ncbi:hypothetical protein BDW22DRAFT_1432267 [Trametopsis cervina]|nr:hypothetical protein BDW22DRAFT_1432267 [Trametopsis cervina]
MQANTISTVLNEATAAGVQACIGRKGGFEQPFTTNFVKAIEKKGGKAISAHIHDSRTVELDTGCDVQIDWVRVFKEKLNYIPSMQEVKASCFLQIKVVYRTYREYMNSAGKTVPDGVDVPDQPYFELFYWSTGSPNYQAILLDRHVEKESKGARTFGGYLLVEPAFDQNGVAVSCSLKYLGLDAIKELTTLTTSYFDATFNVDQANDLVKVHTQRVKVAKAAYARAHSWDIMPSYIEHY